MNGGSCETSVLSDARFPTTTLAKSEHVSIAERLPSRKRLGFLGAGDVVEGSASALSCLVYAHLTNFSRHSPKNHYPVVPSTSTFPQTSTHTATTPR